MSSSRGDDSFRSFLARSLDILREDVPAAYTRMLAAMGKREMLIEVDGERVSFAFVGGSVIWLDEPERPMARVRTTRKVILDLIDGRALLLDVLLRDEVETFGTVDELISFHDALMAYVAGTVRGRRFPGLLEEFRGEEVGA